MHASAASGALQLLVAHTSMSLRLKEAAAAPKAAGLCTSVRLAAAAAAPKAAREALRLARLSAPV
jgi:hypothetical protein